MNKVYGRVLTAGVLSMVAVMLWGGTVLAQGNRYDLPRSYHSEISAARAYLLLSHSKGVKHDPFKNPVLIDVRDVSEYGASHPEGAVHIPFPHIYRRPGDAQYIAQDPQVFVAAVQAAVPDLNQPILTLCRTGFRSVLAANLLAEAGYTKVRNIWEGFIGQYKVDTAGNTLDLNNDGVIDDNDKDGWFNYQELPYSTKLKKKLLYAPYAHLYP